MEVIMTVLEIQQPRNLLELNEQEKRVVELHLGVTVNQAVALLLAAQEWAFKNATPQNFEYRFPEFIAMYKLTPAMANVASTFILDQTASDEEQEADRRGFELLCSRNRMKLGARPANRFGTPSWKVLRRLRSKRQQVRT